MAEKTTKPEVQPASVEDRLKNLYKLQTILSQIDRIRTVRGELPLEVKDLEDTIEGLRTRLDNYQRDVQTLRDKTVDEQRKINDARADIARYREQIDNIRNNKEFDLLNKEINYRELEIQLAEKHLNEYARAIDAKQLEIEGTRNELTLQEQAHLDKSNELDEIVRETKKEEEDLLVQAKQLEPSIDERTLNAFKRIRRNARNGLGIVYIQRNACGGCFNRIPPQRQMEIKMHKKILVCEYCGRIMIDPALAGVDNPDAE